MDKWLSEGKFGDIELVKRGESKGAVACACDSTSTVRCVLIFA